MIQNELKTSVYDIAVFALILWWNCSAASQKNTFRHACSPFSRFSSCVFPGRSCKNAMFTSIKIPFIQTKYNNDDVGVKIPFDPNIIIIINYQFLL